MTIILDIAPELRAELARQAAAQGSPVEAYAASLLEEAAHRKEAHAPPQLRTREEIRAWLDELASLSERIPPRPGETFSREMIYQDHE